MNPYEQQLIAYMRLANVNDGVIVRVASREVVSEIHFAICPYCGMPERFGRHHFLVLFHKKQVFACDPNYTNVKVHEELLDEIDFLKRVTLAALSDDRQALKRLVNELKHKSKVKSDGQGREGVLGTSHECAIRNSRIPRNMPVSHGAWRGFESKTKEAGREA